MYCEPDFFSLVTPAASLPELVHAAWRHGSKQGGLREGRTNRKLNATVLPGLSSLLSRKGSWAVIRVHLFCWLVFYF